jgi:hypothetical protein
MERPRDPTGVLLAIGYKTDTLLAMLNGPKNEETLVQPPKRRGLWIP